MKVRDLTVITKLPRINALDGAARLPLERKARGNATGTPIAYGNVSPGD